MDIDSDIIDRREQDLFLNDWAFQPGSVDVLEILLFSIGAPQIWKFKLGPKELVKWADRKSWPRSLKEREKAPNVVGELRLIFANPVTDEKKPERFPIDEPTTRRVVPFERKVLKHIQNQLQLPFLPCQFPGSYSRSAPISDGKTICNGTKIILTYPGYNNFGVGAVASISHLEEAGITNIMLFHMSRQQELSLVDNVISMAVLTSHPVAVPVLLCSLRLGTIEPLARQFTADVLALEADAGLNSHSGDASLSKKERSKVGSLSPLAIRLNQSTIDQFCSAKQSTFPISVLQDLVQSIAASDGDQEGAVLKLQRRQNSILAQQLTRLKSQLDAVLITLEAMRGRVELQFAGLHSHLASKNNEINQSLAKSSQRIAQETRKDSSAMKSIAVLTMVFLPATYIATLFATPGVAEMKPSVSLYWGVALPVTTGVVVFWFVWTWIENWRIDRSGKPVLDGKKDPYGV